MPGMSIKKMEEIQLEEINVQSMMLATLNQLCSKNGVTEGEIT
jgi:hypothetical protein